MRLLNDTAFGQDVSLAGQQLTYRIDTLTSEGTTSQGRDQSYVLPALALRVLSLVPGAARDIRDASTLTFADLEARRFRARVLSILGWVLYALGGAVAALALVRAYSGLGAPARPRSTLVSGRAILRQARRELSAVNRARQSEGWTDALLGRAAAAMRIVGGYAIGKPAAQGSGRASQGARGADRAHPGAAAPAPRAGVLAGDARRLGVGGRGQRRSAAAARRPRRADLGPVRTAKPR